LIIWLKSLCDDDFNWGEWVNQIRRKVRKIVELQRGTGLKLGLIGFVFGADGLKLGLIGFELGLIGFVWVCFAGVCEVIHFHNTMLKQKLCSFGQSGNWVCFA